MSTMNRRRFLGIAGGAALAASVPWRLHGWRAGAAERLPGSLPFPERPAGMLHPDLVPELANIDHIFLLILRVVFLSGVLCREGPVQLPGSTEVLRVAQDDRAFPGMDVHPSQTLTSGICHPAGEGVTKMQPPKIYFVYIMSNRSKTLYTGVTNSLVRSVREHKSGRGSCFASKYKLDRLVFLNNLKTFVMRLRRERYQRLVAGQEDRVDCLCQSGVEGLESGVVRTPSVSARAGSRCPTVPLLKITWSSVPRRQETCATGSECIGPSRCSG